MFSFLSTCCVLPWDRGPGLQVGSWRLREGGSFDSLWLGGVGSGVVVQTGVTGRVNRGCFL